MSNENGKPKCYGLLEEEKFIRYCQHKGLRINLRFLKAAEKDKFLLPLLRTHRQGSSNLLPATSGLKGTSIYDCLCQERRLWPVYFKLYQNSYSKTSLNEKATQRVAGGKNRPIR